MEEQFFVPDYTWEEESETITGEPTKQHWMFGNKWHRRKQSFTTTQRKRKTVKQACPKPGCGHITKQLKRHVIRHHICPRWWFIYPLLSCWECRNWEIASHIKSHGQFCTDRSLQELAFLTEGFVTYLCNILGVKSSDDLLKFVSLNNLGDKNSSFKEEELAIWNKYDAHIGHPPIVDRSLISPTRVSSIFHWRTLLRILAYKPYNERQTGSFIDSHCHVDRLLHRANYFGTLSLKR